MTSELETLAHDTPARTGVLLVNLGTPDSPTRRDVRRYLGEFLADPRVVEIPRAIWLPILYGVVLPFRPARVAHAYASIWRNDGSPLLVHSRRLAEALGRHLQPEFGDELRVEAAMRYGQPSIGAAIRRLESQNVQRLLVLPMYPQYSGSTTASVMDAVFAALKQMRRMPELRSVHQYHDDAGYIDALAASVRAHWQAHGRGERLLLSFHGIPRRYVEAGDPYYCQCQKTGRLLREALALNEDECALAFQSRFGRAPWLRPYTDLTLQAWAREGLGTVDVICPGFSADCLETLEEIAIRNREDYLAAGGRELRYIPALNDDARHVEFIGSIVRRALGGWAPGTEDAAVLQARQRRIEHLRPLFAD